MTDNIENAVLKPKRKVVAKKAAVKQPMPVYEILDTDYENKWLFNEKEFNSTDIKDGHGFIYLIEEISTGRKYIGQKQFWTKKIRTVNKKKKKIKAESDWKKYYSSSAYINEQVEKNGTADFRRHILVICCSDGQMNYVELKLHMDLRVLEQPDKFINGYLGGRISQSHIKFDKIVDCDKNHLNKLYNTHGYFGFTK